MNQNVAFSNNHTYHNIIKFNIGVDFEHRVFENIAWIAKIGSIGNYYLEIGQFSQTSPNHKYQIWFSVLIQIIGAVCVGLVAHYFTSYSVYRNVHGYYAELMFLLMATSFLIGTFCLLVSCLFSLSTGGIISKTIYVSEKLPLFEQRIYLINFFLFTLIGAHLPFSCLCFALMCISLFAREN